MSIRTIWADEQRIRFEFSGSIERIFEYASSVEPVLLSEATPEADGSIPRFIAGRDRALSAFSVADGERCYVTQCSSETDYPYPQPDSLKTLYGTDEDIRILGLKQTMLNINLLSLFSYGAREDTVSYEHNGKTYFLRREKIRELDQFMIHMHEMGVLVTLILLNSPRLFGSTQEPGLLKAAVHPGYEWTRKDAFISAFNVRTEEGMGYFTAFVDFLSKRYSREDAKYGRALGMIISNEVDSQAVWGNAGPMPVEQYASEYTLAMRMAWLTARRHYAHYRIYMSLDQFWCGARFLPSEPLSSYCGRDLVDLVSESAKRGGDFDWNVAYHPYPEDLRWPDFWHDRAPDFTFSTPKITFKNMEVLEAYLSQDRLLYKGKPRRIIFSEQGFNSQDGQLGPLTEKWAAAGYCLAYLKVKNMSTVDLFMHHAYVDNPHEFGLNLGIRRYDPDAPMHAGEKKPIYESVRGMDTPDEPRIIAEAREVIGEELFDYLLAPPLVYGDRDTSRDGEFG